MRLVPDVPEALSAEVDRQAVQQIVHVVDDVLRDLPVSASLRVRLVRWRGLLTGEWRLRLLQPAQPRRDRQADRVG